MGDVFPPFSNMLESRKMNQEKLLQDVISLPPIAQQEVVDFIALLKLWKWATRRHNNDHKGKRWIKNKYFKH